MRCKEHGCRKMYHEVHEVISSWTDPSFLGGETTLLKSRSKQPSEWIVIEAAQSKKITKSKMDRLWSRRNLKNFQRSFRELRPELQKRTMRRYATVSMGERNSNSLHEGGSTQVLNLDIARRHYCPFPTPLRLSQISTERQNLSMQFLGGVLHPVAV